MKKFLLAIMAVASFAFAGCKVQTSVITVSVVREVRTGDSITTEPVANCPVYYTDLATGLIDILAPIDPADPFGVFDSSYESVKTDSRGIAKIQWETVLKNNTLYFYVYDEKTKKMVSQKATVKAGSPLEVELKMTLK